MTAIAQLPTPSGGTFSQDNLAAIDAAFTQLNSVLAGVPAVLNSAAQGTFRNNQSEVQLAYAGSTAITGSVVGVRGAVTLALGTTLTAGYSYGVQGKLIIQGTVNVAGGGYQAAVLAQVDTSGASATLTAGQVAALWVDMGATSSVVSSANLNGVIITNTTNCIMNAAIQVIANASYLFDLSDVAYGGAHWLVDTTAATAAGCIKVKAGGNTRYLQLYSSAS